MYCMCCGFNISHMRMRSYSHLCACCLRQLEHVFTVYVRKVVEGKNEGTFFTEIMSNLNVFVAGNIHQGSEQFSDISRRRQCFFMSFSALLLIFISDFADRTVDRI